MQPRRLRSLLTDVLRHQLDPEWIELKPDESLEKCAQTICEVFLKSRSDGR